MAALLTDYHVHLRPDEEGTPFERHMTAANADRYRTVATERGIVELGVSEHVYRFTQALDVWQHELWVQTATDDLDKQVRRAVEQGARIACGGHRLQRPGFFYAPTVLLRAEGTAAWRHWSFGFEPAFRSHLMAHRRGIPVEIETWQDDSWAQGAAALVLATPFDDGVSGDQGRLIRERLVENAGRS